MKIEDKFQAAVSDTDILIDLFKCNAYDILNLLFDKILIPEYIFEKELKKVASRIKGISLYDMKKYFEDEESPFEIEMKEESGEVFDKESERLSGFYKRHGFECYRESTWVYHEW